MASPLAAAVPEISEQLLAELSGLGDDSFDRLLRCAIDNAFQFPQEGASVAVPLTISSSSHVSVSDGTAVADAIVINSSTDAVDQPASVVEEYTIHSDIGPSASIACSRFSHEPESIEDIDLAIAEAELRVLKAERAIVMRSKASSEASLTSLQALKKRIRSTGASSVGGAIHTAASSSGIN